VVYSEHSAEKERESSQLEFNTVSMRHGNSCVRCKYVRY